MSADTDPPPEVEWHGKRPFSRLRRGFELRLLGKLFRIASVLAALVYPAARLVARWSWFADLVTHFQVAALVATLTAVAATCRSWRKTSAVLVVLALFQSWPIVRCYGPNPAAPDPASDERLRVLLTNVYFLSRNYDDLSALIRAERPDVVGIVEYSSFCRAWLEPLREEFPYRTEYEDGPGGIALWSRKPLRFIEPVRWIGPEMNPIAHAVIDFAGSPRHVWVVHPTSPLWTGRRFQAGNAELARIAEIVRDAGGSRIVVGDMNCTDGSPHFADFLAVTGLRDSRLGFGMQPSWPTDFLYRIAIDHAFVSNDLAVVDRRLGPVLNSDHYPIIVDLAPAAPSVRSQSAAAGIAH